jgi:hypothetical protein
VSSIVVVRSRVVLIQLAALTTAIAAAAGGGGLATAAVHNGKDIIIRVISWDTITCESVPVKERKLKKSKEGVGYFKFITSIVFGIVAPGHGLVINHVISSANLRFKIVV